MDTFGDRMIEKLTFFQWINAEYGIVKRQYKGLRKSEKEQLNKEYKQYLAE